MFLSFGMEYLFIGGSPKSGTTYLFERLSCHLGVVPSSPKETFFFLDKGHPLLNRQRNCHQTPLSAFDSFFPARGEGEGSYFLEATPHLLYQMEVGEYIQSLEGSRMLFTLREPAQRILSSFHFTKYNLGNFREDVAFADYAEALLRGDHARIKAWLRPGASQYILCRELDYGHYTRFLGNWLGVLGRSRVRVLQFEYLLENEAEVIFGLCEWLGLSVDGFYLERVERNPSYQIKYPGIHHYLQMLNRRMPAGRFKNWVKRGYFSLQSHRRPAMTDRDRQLLGELGKCFGESNRLLTERYGFDLDLWVLP